MMFLYRLCQRFITRGLPRTAATRRNRRETGSYCRLHFEEMEQRLMPDGVPTPDHVVIVIEENHGYADIIGGTDAPYINHTLAASGASFTSSYAITHPSEPNYLALFSGDTQGVTDDGTYTFDTGNLAKSLVDNGLTFGGYSEDLPYTGYTGDTYDAYARKHAPWVSFSNLPSSVNMPFASFPTDYSTLPTLSIVVPNQNNDMHDGSIATADAWLQNNLGGYVQWASTHNSLLIVTWDEDDSSGANQIPTIFEGPMVTAGTYAETINHYNVLRTLEDMYGLDYINNEADVSTITDLWVPAAPSNLSAVVSSSSQVNLSWAANSSNQTGFEVERATDSAFTQNVTLLTTTAATSYSDTSLTASSTYYYRLRATNAYGDSPNSDVAGVTTLPAGWTAADIGGPGISGSTTFDGTTWTVQGGGADIWSAPDQFQYAYESVTGDTTIIARVTSVQNTSDFAKAGVMFREGADSDAPYVALLQNVNNQVQMQWRDTAGADSDWNGGPVGDTTHVKWLALVRSDDAFAAYYATTTGTPASADWILVASHTLAMVAPTGGLAVTAADNTTLCTATFTDVGVIGQWVQTTAADFSAGSNRGTTITSTAGGEVQLAASSLRGIFTSAIFDAGRAAAWGAASWMADVPPGTTLVVETRSGDTAAPGESWSVWTAVANGEAVSSPGARYLQYRLILRSTSTDLTPVLYDITFLWT